MPDRHGSSRSMLSRLAEVSLLWSSGHPPEDVDRPRRLDEHTREDLRMDRWIDAVFSQASTRRIAEDLLARPLGQESRELRDDRWAVVEALSSLPKLRQSVRDLENRTAELQTLAERPGDRELLKLVWRLGDLTLLVDSLGELSQHLSEAGEALTARPLQALRDLLARLQKDRQFQHLQRELPRLRDGLRNRRSVTVGVNLDDRLRPVEAVLLSIHDEAFDDRSILGNVVATILGTAAPSARARVRRNTVPGDWPDASSSTPLDPLFEDLDTLLRDVSGPLSRGLKRFNAVEVSWFRRLVSELALYCDLAEYRDRLVSAGHQVCSADVLPEGPLEAQALIDPVLALGRTREDAPVVPTDIQLFSQTPAAIVTGPNNGGKTTLLRAVGIAHLCANAGFPVAAQQFTSREGLRVLSEFAGGESVATEQGRFAYEAERLAQVLERSGSDTLLLLNESLSSTGASDALEIATELLEVAAERGAWVIFATHLHELPRRMVERGSATSLTIRPGDLYRVVEALPDGRSLAREVARRAGLDFERLRRGGSAALRTDERRLEQGNPDPPK